MNKDLQSSSFREVKTRSSKWLHSHNRSPEFKRISSSFILTPSGSLLSLISGHRMLKSCVRIEPSTQPLKPRLVTAPSLQTKLHREITPSLGINCFFLFACYPLRWNSRVFKGVSSTAASSSGSLSAPLTHPFCRIHWAAISKIICLGRLGLHSAFVIASSYCLKRTNIKFEKNNLFLSTPL